MRRLAAPAAGFLVGLTALLGLPVEATAQARVVVTPSLSLAYVYDDNLFYEAAGEREAIWRLTSGLAVTRDTQRTSLVADLSFDVERFREHRTLSSPLARQAASFRTRTQASQRVAFGFEGGFDSTRAPTELNLTTGLLTGRRRAYRLYGAPHVITDLTPTAKLTLEYDFNADIIPKGALLLPAGTGEVLEALAPASRLDTHIVGARLTQGVTPRHELRVDYVARWFRIGETVPIPTVAGNGFAPIAGTTIGTHTALIGWAFRINPAARIEFAAGPRLQQGRFGIQGVEAEALLSRQRPTHDVFLSYVRTVTTAVGLTSLIDIDRGLLRAVYRPPFGVQTEAEVGFYRNAIDEQSVRVLHLMGGVVIPIAGPLSVGGSYSVDFQHGRFGIDPTIVPVVLTTPAAVPALLVDPNAPMRRGVAMIRVILSPQIRRVPEDPPPGATPVRTPPVKRSDR